MKLKKYYEVSDFMLPVIFLTEFRPTCRFLTSFAFIAKNSNDVRGENINILPELFVLGVNAIEFTLLSEIILTAGGFMKVNLEA